MANLPHRESLVSQTAAILRQEISSGTWSDWLPGERTLCDRLQISRNTVRAALAHLRRERLVVPEQGSGYRIKRKPASAAHRASAPRNVALLSPESLEHLRPTQTLWIDELRALLNERDCRLHVFSGAQYFRPGSGRALARLMDQNPHGCWVLTLSTPATQRWFQRHVPQSIVAGSVYDGVDLPFRDLDHRAICRHAAGTLLGLGHRRIALVLQRTRLAGDLESELGFKESVAQSTEQRAQALVCLHDSSVTGIARAIRRLMEATDRPTALVVAHAFHYLTVVTQLAQMGLHVPQDVAVISRDEDSFMPYLLPSPARYVTQPRRLARALLGPIVELLDGGNLGQRGAHLMPDFIRGDSIAPPAAELPTLA